MSDIAIISQAIKFIETNLRETVNVADMAASVSFSLFHFSREFSRITRHTPYDYLMRRRLCEAARCLLDGDRKIIEIALDYQFNAPETFSRAFKRLFHLQPRQVKMGHSFDRRQLMGEFTPEYLQFINGPIPLNPVAIKLPAMSLMGIMAEVSTADHNQAIANLWSSLRRELQAGGYAAAGRSYYGLKITYPSYPAAKFMYMAGTCLVPGELIPSYFVPREITAADYASFAIPHGAGDRRFLRDFTYHTWWPKATSAPLPMIELQLLPDLADQAGSPLEMPAAKSLYFPLPEGKT